VVELLPQQSGLRPGRARCRIDLDALHRRQIDHEPAIAHRRSRNVVAAAPHRCQYLVRDGETDRLEHVGSARAVHDQGGPLVDHRVPDLPGRVVADIGGCQDGAAHARAQASDGRRLEHALRTWGLGINGTENRGKHR
jgi:hypothetical protein